MLHLFWSGFGSYGSDDFGSSSDSVTKNVANINKSNRRAFTLDVETTYKNYDYGSSR